MEIPKQLRHKGINFVLIEKGCKKPFQLGWQNKQLEYDNPELLIHLGSNGNYGVRGGGGKKLIIVDFDDNVVQEDAMKKLPETFTIKTGSGMYHLYYECDVANPESFKGFSENLDTLFDVQGEGKQVVGPGSTHPNGNRYEVVNPLDIQPIAYAELKAILLPYDRKPKKEEKKGEAIKQHEHIEDSFLDDIKRKISPKDVLSWMGLDTSSNPTQCPMHNSEHGKCLGFNSETAHCFHCDGSWNIFSLIMDGKKVKFKEALETLAKIGGMEKELEESKKRYADKLKQSDTNEYNNIRTQFIQCISGKEKHWDQASELLANFIENKMFIYTTKDDMKSEVWIYREGIYVPQGKSEIKEFLRGLLAEHYSTYVYNLVIAKIEPDTYIDQETFFNHNYVDEIPVKNGLLNLQTRELLPFTPEKIFFNKLPVEYKKEAICPQIDKFVSEVLTSFDDMDVFYEMGGFCLWKEYKFEKAFMLVGNGRNGKDKSLELIKRLLGVENCCSVPLAAIVPESFIISEFHNKMANLAGEISNQDLKDATAFKALTGRSLQSAPRKFLQPVTFVNYAKFIFACNELPMVYENNKGFWDRWVVLEFPFTFVTQPELSTIPEADKINFKLRDEGIIEKITTPEEMSGLLNRFLDGLTRLLTFKNFSNSKGSDEIKKLWIRKSNSVMAFCMDMVEENYERYISKKSFRKKYTEFCKLHKVSIRSDFVIKRTLEELFGTTESNKEVMDSWERVWDGIAWKQ